MDRRNFLAASVATMGAANAVAASANPGSGVTVAKPDGLNPVGIRTAGVRMVPVAGGKYKVWTKKIGSGPVKVLLLHGGPGFTHEYLEAMEAFLPQAGIEMYYYDQLGCGNSDQPDDETLWTVPRYLQEVEEVRTGLGLDNLVLYGHSWGGILAIEYALQYQRHLRGVVISNMTASIDSLLRHLAEIKRRLPAASQAKLQALEDAQAYDSPEYEQIMMEELYPMAVCRIAPWPDAVNRAFRHANQKIYNHMQGKSEFVVTGNLKGWDRWDRLHEIKVPALTMGATHDEMDPADMRKMASLMPHGRAAICANGSHLSMWDDQAVYFEHLLKFLKTLKSA
ncbi:proline iminopeptidase-family hydrolase [Duganella callida]|uniref:Alpha/beta fold hydrolase n=1 Tax=Duganella callida TaxID=2561932 RepID=A0A4Y9SNF1_9BURK|nr:proline iminopeptidase-family hydrolase [Duganella callida]TFW27981.1 alpha/beta fold hydrolase [Duganella callida]